MAANILESTPPDIRKYLTTYEEWLKSQGVTHRASVKHRKQARAFLVRQSDDFPKEFEEFTETPGNSIMETHRRHWAQYNGKRVLPLTQREKEDVQAASSRIGDNPPLRLRNAALISLLLNPSPKAVRPKSFRWVKFNDLYREEEGKLLKFSEWPVLEIDPLYTISGVKVATRTGSELLRLGDNASTHLSSYVMGQPGWLTIKGQWNSYLFTQSGNYYEYAGKYPDPMSRQSIWTLVRNAGQDADIIGTLYPDILSGEPVWDYTNEKRK